MKRQPLVQKDFLKAKGHTLVNQNGDVVHLRGVNAGGWLIQENWMCPVSGEDRKWANLDTLQTLEKRGFTKSEISKLYQTYQDNWFNERDLDILAEMGINCLRVPFWYRNFMKDELGNWLSPLDLDQNPGIKRLDWVIESCGERGIYVILDCHGAPGGQSMDHCCGTLMENRLYDTPKYRAILVDLWITLAKRYENNPVVAALDLLNEPQNNGGYEGDNNWRPGSMDALERTYGMYDELYQAIREVNSEHVITVEAIWDGRCLPNPHSYGWTNVLYQMHIYDTTKEGIDTRIGELVDYMEAYQVPAYAGEFQCEPLGAYVMEAFNKHGIHWTTWAYKGAKQTPGNPWFLFVGELKEANIERDSFQVLLERWGKVLQTDNFHINENGIVGLIRQKVRPLETIII